MSTPCPRSNFFICIFLKTTILKNVPYGPVQNFLQNVHFVPYGPVPYRTGPLLISLSLFQVQKDLQENNPNYNDILYNIV